MISEMSFGFLLIQPRWYIPSSQFKFHGWSIHGFKTRTVSYTLWFLGKYVFLFVDHILLLA